MMNVPSKLDDSAVGKTVVAGLATRIAQYFGAAAVAVLLALPSLWLLTHFWPWVTWLEAMALGTYIPLLVFGLIGGLRLVCRDAPASSLECAAITLCFACLQAYIFNTGLHPENRFNLVGGLLPNADPSMYLSLANQWNDGIRPRFSVRQLFPCFLSSMLWICQRDLKIIVSTFTLITGVVSFLAWRQVRMTLGWLSATLFVGLVFFFYRTHVVGLLRTEQLGLWFALIGLALLLHGLRDKRQGLWCAGLFSLVMGLNTRAGAYFIVPFLILFSGWFFRRGVWGWRSIVAATAVVLTAMLLDVASYLIFFAPPRSPSNFWYSFYGMLKGGSWVTALNEVGHNFNLAREKGLALLRSNPSLVLKGFVRACAYIWQANTFYDVPPTTEAFRFLMKWLTAIGAVLPWSWSIARKQRADLEWFLLLVTLGTLISLPFAPPWDVGLRVYAATLPFIYLAPAVLIAWSSQRLRSLLSSGSIFGNLFPGASPTATSGERITHLTKASLAILVLLSTVMPLGLMLSNRHTIRGWSPNFCAPVPKGCPANDLPAGYQIHLISDTRRTFVPWIRVSDFRASLNESWEVVLAPWLVDLLSDLPEGTTIGTAAHSKFFVIGTDKAVTPKMSLRHPILNPGWHRVIYDNDFPLSAYAQQILKQPQAPPPLLSR